MVAFTYHVTQKKGQIPDLRCRDNQVKIGNFSLLSIYNPKSEKVGTVWKTQIKKKKVVIFKFTLTCISLQTI